VFDHHRVDRGDPTAYTAYQRSRPPRELQPFYIHGSFSALLPLDHPDSRDSYHRGRLDGTANEPVNDLTAERLFERRWATSLLDHAVAISITRRGNSTRRPLALRNR
jgi:hypothetical protein